ncbi:SoxR reducing system RseC family protein [Chitinibacter tainanensis]|uniref:SoxR reducing system RseC family protein n=1 Tax=Chitinibacter tainanensis TaxID=230667 RepID=UPI00040470FF|nr:SoxR reducing system RseC family protein [Chitinibacter tainanensis]
MIETQAQVVRTDGDYAWIKIRPHTPCGNCDPDKGCKSVAITRLFGQAQDQYRVRNPLAAQAGELVTVGLAEQALLSSALWAYGLPMLLLLLGAFLGSLLPLAGEAGTLAGAALGFITGFLCLKKQAKSPIHSNEPAIIAKLPASAAGSSCPSSRTI